jgi:hypothetical protein
MASWHKKIKNYHDRAQLIKVCLASAAVPFRMVNRVPLLFGDDIDYFLSPVEQ